MAQPSSHEVTLLLRAWDAGDKQALDQLIPLMYEELRRLAAQCLAGEQQGHVLQTTALVHEVYVRLAGVESVGWRNRAHFFALCARLMRRILIDLARSRHYQKRGSNAIHLQLDEALTVSMETAPDILAVDIALQSLATVDPRKSQMVELRFFGGLTVEETAEVMQISPETVLRDWRLAKAWLTRELAAR
ncbi:MAG: RNA polymerase subunit sigma-70 [Acidobacteria bacterium]|nr:MAG: RNA polymerase subunit sigma-70 [Acidobacteriota bacterium]